MENVHLKEEDKQMEEKDWELSDKFNFCNESSNTSQQAVNNIVPESQEQPKTKSHSSESSYETEDSEEDVGYRRSNLDFQRSQNSILDIPDLCLPKNNLNSMSSLESVASSVAASMAAVAAMNNISLQKSFGNLRFSSNVPADVVPQWYLPPRNFKLETAAKQEEPHMDTNDDQPLDLSAKSCSPLHSPIESPTEVRSPIFTSVQNFSSSTSPSPSQSSLKVPVFNSNRHIFKAKPRLSPMAGRRTYTEEELQAALRDIQSGKLGTRRAAVIYGIPRSTLRNKVYKLAMEKERDNSATLPNLVLEEKRLESEVDGPSDDKEELEDRENEHEEEDEEVEKDLSAIEEERDEKGFIKPTFTVEDLIRFSKHTSPLVENDSLKALFQQSSKFLAEQTMKRDKDSTTSSQLPPPLYSIFPPGASEIWGNLDAASIAPYLTHLLDTRKENFNISSLLSHPNPYFNMCNQNSSESLTDASSSFSSKFPVPLFPEIMQRMLAESQEQRKRETQNSNKTCESNSGPFSSTPVENQDELANSSSNILHRLPFFKPVYKNGSTSESDYCKMSNYNPDHRISEGSEKSVTSSPPLVSTTRSESSSPLPINHKSLNLRDVIVKAIGPKYQPSLEGPIQNIPGNSSIEGLQRVSFPPLAINSVIKSHSGVQTDERKLCNQSKVPLPSSTANAGCSSGGKGTRPKRGKYRNYDRDSLVEAVRAVQRGEMSVHRAGSFYGVPHSTLEYKVKERHLMRQRKREPKMQSEDLKRREDGSVLRLLSSVSEKTAQQSPSSQPKVSKSSFTPPSSLSTTPNGLKIPAIFETSHQFVPTTPFSFWPAPFHQLAMDYSRNSAFSSNPNHILTSHFMQCMQEELAKNNQLPPSMNALGKNAREVAESLYDGSGANGSFLDGVIRSSLDNDQVFSENAQKKNLLEQICKNKYLNPSSRNDDESDDDGSKSNINQIWAQTLLSSVHTSKDKSSKDSEDSNDEKSQPSTSAPIDAAEHDCQSKESLNLKLKTESQTADRETPEINSEMN